MVIYDSSSKFKEKVQICQDYIGALEEERRKIQVFERELPLCVELVSQAIERCRQQMCGTITDCFNGQSDRFSGQTLSEGPVLEEFIPIKRTSSTNDQQDIDDDDDEQKQQSSNKSKIIFGETKPSLISTKSDWLTSAQLSIQTQDPPVEKDLFSKKLLAMEGSKNECGAFHPFQKKKTSGSKSVGTDGGGNDGGGGGGGGGGGNKDDEKGESNKKERRCWSPELHRRFLHALQQLGGAHVATPKQIRELMKVDGLTNDEIKSHLQKYRLHTRRVNPTTHKADTYSPQLMVVGRIWMPPLEYTTMATSSPISNAANNSKAVYTPIATLPSSITASLYKTKQCKKQLQMVGKGSHNRSVSPPTSSSM